MGTSSFLGNANVSDTAIDVDSPEFRAKFGPADDDGSEFDPPADFDDSQVPDIIRQMQPKKKLTEKQKAAAAAKKARDAEKKKATAQKEKDRKAAERDAEKRKKEAEREEAKARKAAEKEAGPDISDVVTDKQAIKYTLVHVPVDELDGIDGGDPVERSFVETVRTAGRIINPITVRKEENGRYNILAGKRRAQAVRELGWPTIPATVENRDGISDHVIGLQENIARSENVIEQHRMVMALYDHFTGTKGMTERQATKAITKATGMTPFQVKRARDMGRLVPELLEAVESGAMTKWSALNAARLPVEAQARLVETLEEAGHVTADDVRAARSAKQRDALGKVAKTGDDQGMFDNPEDADDTTGGNADAPLYQALARLHESLAVGQDRSEWANKALDALESLLNDYDNAQAA